MSYTTERDFYKLWELAIGSSAGQGPFISENSVTRIDAGQRLAGAAASPASIWQNDVFPYKGQDILRVNLAARLPSAAGAGDEAFFGIAGAKAAIDSLTQAIGFKVDGNSTVRAVIYDASGLTEEVTGITLANEWKEFQIDLYTGVYSQSAPAVSVGGIGNVRFSVGNDQGLLRPVGINTQFDMSAHAGDGFQILATAESSGTLDLDLKFVSVEHRNLPAA